jgi:drug/metabolite transporter (DMT)-like permease
MSPTQILLLILYAAGMAAGQTLFKLSSISLSASTPAHGSLIDRAGQILLNPTFVLAIILYMGLSILWVKILSFTPLNRAYPFTALAFVFTAAIGTAVFQENLNRFNIIGIALIMTGLLFISRA